MKPLIARGLEVNLHVSDLYIWWANDCSSLTNILGEIIENGLINFHSTTHLSKSLVLLMVAGRMGAAGIGTRKRSLSLSKFYTCSVRIGISISLKLNSRTIYSDLFEWANMLSPIYTQSLCMCISLCCPIGILCGPKWRKNWAISYTSTESPYAFRTKQGSQCARLWEDTISRPGSGTCHYHRRWTQPFGLTTHDSFSRG